MITLWYGVNPDSIHLKYLPRQTHTLRKDACRHGLLYPGQDRPYGLRATTGFCICWTANKFRHDRSDSGHICAQIFLYRFTIEIGHMTCGRLTIGTQGPGKRCGCVPFGVPLLKKNLIIIVIGVNTLQS